MAIEFINSTAADFPTSASTWSFEVHSSREGGAAYVIGLGANSTATAVSSVILRTSTTASSGLVFIKASSVGSTRDDSAEMWYLNNISSASTRVHIGWTGASSGSIAMGQWRGFSTGTPLTAAGSSGSTASAETAHSASEITPTSTGVVITFSRLNAGPGATTPGANFTEWADTNAIPRSFGQYWIQTDITATDGPWTASSGSANAQVIVAFADTVVTAVVGRNRMLTLLGVG